MIGSHSPPPENLFAPAASAQSSSTPYRDSLPRELRRDSWSQEDFDIGRKLGEGRFGKIYLAREKQSKYAVVLKCVSKEAVLRHDLAHQIRREVELHMYCRHRHIIRMLAFFWDDERIFMAMDFAEGGDMHRHLDSFPQRIMPEDIAARYLAQLCGAVAYLHARRILHRDIKPDNILLKKGNVKLADFTWAVSCHQERDRRKTLCGTIDYLAPEMVSGQDYSAPIDMWSVGCCAFELLCGTAPFEAFDPRETCQRIQSGGLVFPSHVSPLARDFVHRLLMVDSSRRMGAEEALRHPFVAAHYVRPPRPALPCTSSQPPESDESRRSATAFSCISAVTMSANTTQSLSQQPKGLTMLCSTSSGPPEGSDASTAVGREVWSGNDAATGNVQRALAFDAESPLKKGARCVLEGSVTEASLTISSLREDSSRSLRHDDTLALTAQEALENMQ